MGKEKGMGGIWESFKFGLNMWHNQYRGKGTQRESGIAQYMLHCAEVTTLPGGLGCRGEREKEN